MMCNELSCSQWDLYFSKAALSILCFCKFTRQTIDRMVQWLIIKIQKTLYTSEFDLPFSKLVSQFGNHIKSISQFWCFDAILVFFLKWKFFHFPKKITSVGSSAFQKKLRLDQPTLVIFMHF